MNFLDNAFKSLQRLNEETFDLKAEDTPENLKDFLDQDEEINTLTIIDDEAETPEDLQDSYMGKVILDCNVCHSLMYKDPAEVTVDGDQANVEEECPYCSSIGGYKIIGQVKPFEEVEDELVSDAEEEKEDDLEGTDDELDTIEAEEAEEEKEDDLEGTDGDIKESFRRPSRRSRNYSGRYKSLKESKVRTLKDLLKGLDPDRPFDIIEKSFGDGAEFENKNDKIPQSWLNAAVEDVYEEDGKLTIEILEESCRGDDCDEEDLDEFFDVNAQGQTIGLGFGGGTGISNGGDGGMDMPGLGEGCDDCDDDEDLDEDWYDAEDPHEVYDNAEDPHEVYDDDEDYDIGDTFETEEGCIFKFIGYDDQSDSYGSVMKFEPLNDLAEERAQEEAEDEGFDYDGYWYVEEEGFLDSLGDYIFKKDSLDECGDSSLKEGFNKVDIETDDQHLSMDSDESGKVTITSEPKQADDFGGDDFSDDFGDDFGDDDMSELPPDESIGEVDVDVKQEIEDNSEDSDEEEDEESEEETSEEGEEEESEEGSDEDLDIEEFDEESFDDLGESYLKKVYGNVSSYRTTQVGESGNKMIIEGVIKFNSGSKKKTTFIFENKGVTDAKKALFEGYNKQITRANKTFKMTCDVSRRKVVCERLNYRYKQNKSLVEGVVKRNRK